jgi:multiple sugar transport system permease protein
MTLISMIMPAARAGASHLPRADALHLIGSSLSVILPFSFFPFGVYLAYIYYATAVPRDLLDGARWTAAASGRHSSVSHCHWPSPW